MVVQPVRCCFCKKVFLLPPGKEILSGHYNRDNAPCLGIYTAGRLEEPSR